MTSIAEEFFRDDDEIVFFQGNVRGSLIHNRFYIDRDFNFSASGRAAHDVSSAGISIAAQAAGLKNGGGATEIIARFERQGPGIADTSGDVDDIGGVGELFNRHSGVLELGTFEGRFYVGLGGRHSVAGDLDAAHRGHDDVAAAVDLVAAIKGGILGDRDI